jgi:hypothetical protein
MILSDIYGWNGTENSEVLTLSRATAELESLPTLTMALDATTDYASISLSSTTGLPTAGTVIIGNEQIGYTGISGNTITTCTRGRYSSTKQRHTIGTPVASGLWFTKIKSGAMLCGPIKPS